MTVNSISSPTREEVAVFMRSSPVVMQRLAARFAGDENSGGSGLGVNRPHGRTADVPRRDGGQQSPMLTDELAERMRLANALRAGLRFVLYSRIERHLGPCVLVVTFRDYVAFCYMRKDGLGCLHQQRRRQMIMKHRRVSYPVASLAEASALFCKMRNASFEGGSTWQEATIYSDAGELIGHVSYNGRVWPCSPKAWTPDVEPIYDNQKVPS